MQYFVNVNGIKLPIEWKMYEPRGVAFTFDMGRTVGMIGTTTWTLNSGTLPDGVSLSTSGTLSGTPTTDGTSAFQLKVVDSATPPQFNYVNVTMVVAEPPTITSSAVLTPACSGPPYSFTVQATGGKPPYYFYLLSSSCPFLWLSSTGQFTGTPTTLGTSTSIISVQDSYGFIANQNESLTVQTCP